jgi:hypothetical protein
MSLVNDLADALAKCVKAEDLERASYNHEIYRFTSCSNESWHRIAQGALTDHVMRSSDRYEVMHRLFRYTGRSRIESGDSLDISLPAKNLIRRKLPSILKEYSKFPVDSWRHSLSEVVPEFIELLFLRHGIGHENENGQIESMIMQLELTQEEDLWTADCQTEG